MTRPLIAILRGVEPDRAVETATAARRRRHRLDRGAAELAARRSTSIAAMQAALGDRARIGAGTVLTPEEVRAVAATGASFVVSPNCDPPRHRPQQGSSASAPTPASSPRPNASPRSPPAPTR